MMKLGDTKNKFNKLLLLTLKLCRISGRLQISWMKVSWN